MTSLPKILVVDDNPHNRLALRTALKGVKAELHEASNGFDALSMSLAEEYALILLDVQMAEMDGFEVCEQLRADPRNAHTPVIFLTAAYKNVDDKVRGYVAGATDYLAKPIEDYILKAKVQVFLKLYEQQRLLKENNESLRVAAAVFESHEGMLVSDADNRILRVNRAFTKITGYSADEVIGKNPRILNSGKHDKAFFAAMWESIKTIGHWEGQIWNRRKNGEVYPEQLTITEVKSEDGIVTNYVATLSDVTVSVEAADKIRNLAFYDPLTCLPNRRLLLDRLQQGLISSARSGRSGAILFIDLDNFKTLNDTLGHNVGDLLLQQVARRLATCVRECDTVARLGGDEFVVMLEDLSEQEIEATALAQAVGDKILNAFNQPFQLDAHTHRCTPSIGVALFSDRDREQDQDELLRRADVAMYQAKKNGRNALCFFKPQMQDSIKGLFGKSSG